MRIDRLLFNLRFAKSRTLAQRWIAEGYIRRNGERVVRQDLAVAVGDVLTLPLRRSVVVVEITDLPARRGPPGEARACYRRLDGGGAKGIAGGESREAPREAEGEAQQ